MIYIGDANDRATILQDAGVFFQSYFAATDADETAVVDSDFGLRSFPPYWPLGQQTSGLIQVHDLVAPVDFETSAVLLQRLGAIAGALLANRDDVRGFPEDPFRGRVMPAWGAFTPNRDNKWNTDVSTSSLFVYAMAALARRVAERPDRYTQPLADQAVRMITAAGADQLFAQTQPTDRDFGRSLSRPDGPRRRDPRGPSTRILADPLPDLRGANPAPGDELLRFVRRKSTG
jgi:hypothetical protein